MRPITLIIVALLTALPAFAQQASVEVNALSVTGFVKGTRVNFDAEFSEKHGVEIPAPFTVIFPTSDDHKIFSLPAPGGTGIFKVFFATLDEQTKSNIQFLPFTVDEGTIAEQLEWLRPLLKDAFVASVTDVEQARINYTEVTEIGPYAAIEMVGNYKDPELGTIILRVVAIPNPDGIHGVMAIINGVAATLGMTTVEDIMKTDSSRALGTFKFQ